VKLNKQQIAAVVVTHNRPQLLATCLDCLMKQRRVPDAILVVDCGSEPPVHAESLGPDVRVLRVANIGSAGGFGAGIEHLWGSGYDAFWLMDDDTQPQAGALAALLGAEQWVNPGTAWLASRVVWTDGTLHVMNKPSCSPTQLAALQDMPDTAVVPASAASYVSLLVKRSAIAAGGLPLAEYFIWMDDVEFTLRLSRVGGGGGYFIGASTVEHHTAANRGVEWQDITPANVARFCQALRNKIHFVGLLGASPARCFMIRLATLWRVFFAVIGRHPTLVPQLVVAWCAGFRFRPQVRFPR
jgi:rhamnopyranosyl-N-acetylglucosaminyl-diphospho-decaprenol beta-1,3/1,4-galactofuranosyltransferase